MSDNVKEIRSYRVRRTIMWEPLCFARTSFERGGVLLIEAFKAIRDVDERTGVPKLAPSFI